MSETEPTGDELDRNTITGGQLANWLNKYGPEWVLEIEPLGRETEYLGIEEGRFTLYHEGGIDFVALDYLGDLVDEVQQIGYVHRDDSPLADDDDDADEDE
jgi:hypothetical protein